MARQLVGRIASVVQSAFSFHRSKLLERLCFAFSGAGSLEKESTPGIRDRLGPGDDPIHKIPTREQVELIRRQYPVGTRIILNHMDDSQAPPPGTKGTVAYVDSCSTAFSTMASPASAFP